jgi:DNA-binding response OmpR family regulator
MGLAQIILALLAQAPQAVATITTLYNEVKSDISTTDQATIDAELAKLQSNMPADQAATDQALKAAEGE